MHAEVEDGCLPPWGPHSHTAHLIWKAHTTQTISATELNANANAREGIFHICLSTQECCLASTVGLKEKDWELARHLHKAPMQELA